MGSLTRNDNGVSITVSAYGKSISIRLQDVTIRSVYPSAAKAGEPVQIFGDNLTGATAISFGGVPAATFDVLSDSLIVAVVGAGGSGSVSVSTPAGEDSVSGFSFITVFNGPTEFKLRCDFPMDIEANATLGVFRDDALIRSLGDSKRYAVGDYTEEWDPLTDEKEPITDVSDLKIKLLDHNIQYVWKGTIGNNSDFATGEHIHRGENMEAIAIAGTRAWFATAHGEKNPTHHYFDLATPHQKTQIFIDDRAVPVAQTSLETNFCVTDGVRVYYGCRDSWSSTYSNPKVERSVIFALNCADNKQYVFKSGALVKGGLGYTYKSCISLLEDAPNTVSTLISGLAVQAAGKFIFVAYANRNEVRVLNKTTGELMQTITNLANPRSLAVDKADKLWISYGTNTVQRFTVNATTGTITADIGTILSGLTGPLAMGANRNQDIIIICDKNDQAKAYNSLTGAPLWTLGEAYAYSTSSLVSNTRFYFSDPVAGYQFKTFIAFAPDNSFWLGDPYNSRSLHFTAAREYIEHIQFEPRCYSHAIDLNDPTRLFANFHEYKRDYSKELGPHNGSWIYTNNWGYGLSADYRDKYYIFRRVATSTDNGRTYAQTGRKSATGTMVFETVELVAGGTLRLTGQLTKDTNTLLHADGSMRRLQPAWGNNLGKRAETHFIAHAACYAGGNPLYTPETILAAGPISTARDPIYTGHDKTLSAGEVTDSGLLITTNGERTPNGALDGYHIGAIKIGDDGKYLWKNGVSVPVGYAGPYPSGLYFEQENGANYLGCRPVVIGNHIFFPNHDEFWKGVQVNKWNHYYHNGLLISQFGVTRKDDESYAPPGMAGNLYCPSVCMVGGKVYARGQDEGQHAGLFEFEITGLDTIRVREFIPTLVEVEIGSKIKLLKDMPVSATLANGVGGLEMSTPYGTKDDKNYFAVQTSKKAYDRFKLPDVYAFWRNSGNLQEFMQFDLGEQDTPSWKLEGFICFDQSFYNVDPASKLESGKGGQFFQLLDPAGKPIIRFFIWKANSNSTTGTVYANGVELATMPVSDLDKIRNIYQPIRFRLSDGQLYARYAAFAEQPVAPYDSAAIVTSPKKVGQLFWNKSYPYDKAVGWWELEFSPE